jgi:hypothetical protein
MINNYTKLSMAMTIAVFTIMTALVTMQTTHAFATFVQVNTTFATNQTGNLTGNQTGNQSSQPLIPEQPVYTP